MIQYRKFELNTAGTDWFVGDLHGEYALLIRTLGRVGFDYSVDRLFSVGDLIDRGPDSVRCVELLREPWFYAVLGNHEDMFVLGLEYPVYKDLQIKNGGYWVESHTREELEALAETIMTNTSLALTVETPHGRVGVIHAEAPADWHSVNGPELKPEKFIWSREQHQLAITKRATPIKNIDLTIHGHVSCDFIDKGANQLWIDTLLRGGRLTVISAEQAFEQIA